MICSNCYNGCTSVISDKCVRYTGVDITLLGIKNGDSLSYVEQALATYLTATMDGSGIHLDGLQDSLCCIISESLPTLSVTEGLTALDLFVGLIGAVCKLSEKVTEIQKNSLAYSYELGCLTIDQQSSTEEVLQAVIKFLCQTNSSLTALALNVSTNYVPLSQLNSLIAAYLASQSTSTLLCNKMTPYVVYPFYPPASELSNFSSTGSGTGKYLNIYICNGLNGTPDLRGVTLVGDTTSYAGATFSSKVTPGVNGNPSYSAGSFSIVGNNTITLAPSQVPQHIHTTIVTEANHSHASGTAFGHIAKVTENSGGGSYCHIADNPTEIFTAEQWTAGAKTNLTVAVNPALGNGGGDGICASHNNIQPSVAVYYIMYIPA